MSTKKKKKPAAKKAVKKAASKAAKKTAKKAVVKKTTKKATAKKAAKKPVKKPAKKVIASKAAKKPAKKIAAKKPTKNVAAKKVTKKVVAKAPKPVVKKVVSKAPKAVVKKAKAPTTRAAVATTPPLIHTESTTPSPSPITIHGILAIDTDGTGPSHNDKNQKDKTSAEATATGQFVPLGDPRGVRFLNADVDQYSVAPKNFAKVNGGPLSAGDLATVELPNGTTRSIPIGDFGPNNKAGEFSLAAVQALGVQVLFTHNGPIPTLDGPAASDIPVTVTFHPGSAS